MKEPNKEKPWLKTVMDELDNKNKMTKTERKEIKDYIGESIMKLDYSDDFMKEFLKQSKKKEKERKMKKERKENERKRNKTKLYF